MDWYVRRASLHDEPDLRRLCESSVGPDDYVLDALEYTLLNETILVATDDDGSIIGMMSYRSGIDGSGWLGMVRTRPEFRRRGVARSLIQVAASLASSSAAGYLRFWSDHDNMAANAMARGTGFKEVGRFVRMNGTATKGYTKARKVGYEERNWRLVKESGIIKEGNGFLCHDWCFVPATRKVIFHMAVEGSLSGWKGNILSFIPMKDRFTESLEVSLLTGEIEELLMESQHQAQKAGIQDVSTFLPNSKDLIDRAKGVGFKMGHWGIVAILYEFPIREQCFHKSY